MRPARRLEWLAVLVFASSGAAGWFGEMAIVPYSAGFTGASAGLLLGGTLFLLMRHFDRRHLTNQRIGWSPGQVRQHDVERRRLGRNSTSLQRSAPLQ